MKKILEIFPKILSIFTSGGFKAAVFSILKKEAVKLALSKLARGILKGTFGNWLITFAVEYLMDEFVIPLMKTGFNYMGYQFDKIEGKIYIKRLNDAQNQGNQDEYDDIVIDIWDS